MLALRVTAGWRRELTAMFATPVMGSLVVRGEFGGYNSDSRGTMAAVPAALESRRQKVSPIGRVLHRGEAARHKIKLGWVDGVAESSPLTRVSHHCRTRDAWRIQFFSSFTAMAVHGSRCRATRLVGALRIYSICVSSNHLHHLRPANIAPS